MRVLGSTRKKEFLVREGAVPTDGNNNRHEFDQGQRALASASTCVSTSKHLSGRSKSPIATAWSWKLETPGLSDFPFIKAVFCSRNAIWIRGITGDRCDCMESNKVRALMFQVCLTLCISCGVAWRGPGL